MFELLFILFFVLLTIMVVGHVLWIVAGWFFRLLLGTLPPPRDAVPCPFCERRTDSDRGRCQWCGQSLHSDLATELGDLLAFRRQLKRFEGEGTMTAAEADALSAGGDASQGDHGTAGLETVPRNGPQDTASRARPIAAGPAAR